MDWNTTTKETLDALGGRETCVPGAKLHTEVSKRGWREGEEFGRFLQEQGLTFSSFLDSIPEITVHRFRGTDTLVGFDGAELLVQPGTTTRRTDGFQRIRPDVFEAFTKITSEPYHYIVDSDEFGPEPSNSGTSIPLPMRSLDDLLQQRDAFIATLEEGEAKNELYQAIKWSASPLSAFQRTVKTFGLGGRWHDFRFKTMRDEILAWADAKSINASPEWFAQRAEGPTVESPQQILSQITAHMSDEEIRSLAIPFRAVEEAFKSITRRR